MILLHFDTSQWEDLLGKMDTGQDALATAFEDLSGQLASIQSLLSEQLIVLRQIRDKLPEP